MKLLISTIIFVLPIFAFAQKSVKPDDFGRIVLNTYIPEQIELPVEAKNLLSTKLTQITSNNGIGGSSINERFIITANVNIGTKDIIAGPPQMIAQNVDVTFFVGDVIENTIFSSTTLSVKGVGTNENKAFIDALKRINVNDNRFSTLIEKGKNKIIEYYISQCDFIIKDAMTLTKLEKYNQAIYKLSLIPEVCQDCYFKSLDTLAHIFQEKIDMECEKAFNKAKTIWFSSLDKEGAKKAGELLSRIHPSSKCIDDANKLISEIDEKLKEDEKKEWEFMIRQYEDNLAREQELLEMRKKQNARNFQLQQQRINTYREIATEYAKNQPKSVTKNIYWR
ncbi:hypothetical protein [Anaerophaga thermohalophila]|jgi:hypothetical protein|uniref:hypothetical protein n=1 Tax=Anaerophaga thermohalophila TaxID=177400 RepID=UPI0002E0D793|nr:hypothetical protein [Anaerophaga thermohalophila]